MSYTLGPNSKGSAVTGLRVLKRNFQLRVGMWGPVCCLVQSNTCGREFPISCHRTNSPVTSPALGGKFSHPPFLLITLILQMPHVNPGNTPGLRRLLLEHIKYIYDLSDITLKHDTIILYLSQALSCPLRKTFHNHPKLIAILLLHFKVSGVTWSQN